MASTMADLTMARDTHEEGSGVARATAPMVQAKLVSESVALVEAGDTLDHALEDGNEEELMYTTEELMEIIG